VFGVIKYVSTELFCQKYNSISLLHEIFQMFFTDHSYPALHDHFEARGTLLNTSTIKLMEKKFVTYLDYRSDRADYFLGQF